MYKYVTNFKTSRLKIITVLENAMAQTFIRRLLTTQDGFAPRSVHIEFVVDKVALDLIFPDSLGFFLPVLFHRCSTFTHMTSEGWKTGPLETQFQTHCFTPLQWQQYSKNFWIDRHTTVIA